MINLHIVARLVLRVCEKKKETEDMKGSPLSPRRALNVLKDSAAVNSPDPLTALPPLDVYDTLTTHSAEDQSSKRADKLSLLPFVGTAALCYLLWHWERSDSGHRGKLEGDHHHNPDLPLLQGQHIYHVRQLQG